MNPTPAVRKLLLVASTGGHLAELVRLHPSLGAADDSLWVTFRTPQSETLLAGRRTLYVRYVRPRDLFGVVVVFFTVLWFLRRERFDAAVSTGSGIALACFPAAMLRRIPTSYIESLGRVRGPSVTGTLLARTRMTTMYRQSGSWGQPVWHPHTSALSTFRAVPRAVSTQRPRLFVTLGTIEGYRFDRLVDAVLASGLADERTVWQLGETTRTDLPGTAYTQLSSCDYLAAVRQSDVVISHAGVGSMLVLLEEGVFPILATRRSERNEHVDDHQLQMIEMVEEAGVGVVVDAPDVTADLIRSAQSRAVVDDAADASVVDAVAS